MSSWKASAGMRIARAKRWPYVASTLSRDTRGLGCYGVDRTPLWRTMLAVTCCGVLRRAQQRNCVKTTSAGRAPSRETPRKAREAKRNSARQARQDRKKKKRRKETSANQEWRPRERIKKRLAENGARDALASQTSQKKKNARQERANRRRKSNKQENSTVARGRQRLSGRSLWGRRGPCARGGGWMPRGGWMRWVGSGRAGRGGGCGGGGQGGGCWPQHWGMCGGSPLQPAGGTSRNQGARAPFVVGMCHLIGTAG